MIFKVFGKNDCIFCKEACFLIADSKYDFEYVDIKSNPSVVKPEWKTVPQIYHGDNYVGGYEQLEEYLNDL